MQYVNPPWPRPVKKYLPRPSLIWNLENWPRKYGEYDKGKQEKGSGDKEPDKVEVVEAGVVGHVLLVNTAENMIVL